ncbi:MAG: hypothetical protein E6K18_07905 [Methanobacteriota archaeon]|nr:MAG: hypothetical protein E6K18_07905 [Euryarchaeota archaeon]
MPEDAAPIVLTKGSRYRITSIETRDKPMVSHGIFRGLGTIGTDDAISIELDASHQELAGKMRLIPTHMVVSVDIVEQIEEKKEKAKEPKAMYG